MYVGSCKLFLHSRKGHLVPVFGNFSKGHSDLTYCLTPVKRYNPSLLPSRFHSFVVKGANDVCQQNCTAENHSNTPHGLVLPQNMQNSDAWLLSVYSTLDADSQPGLCDS